MLLFLLLTSLLAYNTMGELELAVPGVPVVAVFGRDTVLNCSFGGEQVSANLSELSVFWQLTDTYRAVHTFMGGTNMLEDQSATFSNRTSLFGSEALAMGNASLLLRSVRVDDEGSYTCFVRVQTYASAAMLLQVAAPYSKPQVTLNAVGEWSTSGSSSLRPGERAELTCTSYGGYPEADVSWQDGTGLNLTDNFTVSQVANELGLFSVQSVLTVTLEPDNTYHCHIGNALLGEEGHVSITFAGHDVGFPPVVLGVCVGLAICLQVLLITLAVVCRTKIKESCEEIRAEEEAKELEEEAKAGLQDTAQTPQPVEGSTPVIELSERD